MKTPSRAFRRRLAGVLTLLGLGVAGCGMLAIAMTRSADRTVQHLASVEFEEVLETREFRGAASDLHETLLGVGTVPEAETAAAIDQRRLRLTQWLAERQRAAETDAERQVLYRLSGELNSYFTLIDRLALQSGHYRRPLDRDTLVQSDAAALRLQRIADEFVGLHGANLRGLRDASLQSVRRLRDLVFLCLVLLFTAIAVVVALLYRDIVKPLRVQLVESERLLAQREKLAALGTLAAGVAHEIRNPLTAIKARLYTLRRLQTQPDAVQDAESIRQEVERLERIVRDVLGYARPAEPRLDDVELGAWLREFGAFVQTEVRAKNIELTVDAPTTACVRADADQLRQIMLNLVRNAVDALAERPGHIALALHSEHTGPASAPVELAVLSVTDDGPGIPAEIQPRLFDPFFTTKSAGTGLGLSIVGRLVENQGGEIVYQTAPGSGTRFSVRLPLLARTAQLSS